MRIARPLLILAATLSASGAFAQSALLQSGPVKAGHAPMYSGQGVTQFIVQDGGGAAGGGLGATLSEIGVTSRSATNTYPVANSGPGPQNTHGCFFDAPTTNATGYHFLCVDPNAGGGGLLAYGAGGGASILPLYFNINGIVTTPGGTSNTIGVGGTAITSGTSGRILYDNAGALGEVATTGSGLVVLGTAPTITLGNATGLPISTGVSGLGSGVATGLASAATGSGGPVLATSPTITTPGIVADNFNVNPQSNAYAINMKFFFPYYTPGGSNSWGYGIDAYGPVPGNTQREGAYINCGATHVTSLSALTGDCDLAVRNGYTDTMELYSLFAGTSGVPGGFIPDVDNQQTNGEYNYAWKYVVGHNLIAEDSTLPTITLNNTTANSTQTIAYQNNGNATFGLNGFYNGGHDSWGLYDNEKTGGAAYDFTQVANGDGTWNPQGAIRLSPVTGYVISSALVVAPDVQLTSLTISALLAMTCNSSSEGTVAYVKDTVGSAAATFHLTVAGGGANAVHSLASCNGTNWQYD